MKNTIKIASFIFLLFLIISFVIVGDFNSFQFGVSYDIINSDLRLASPETGSFEISFNCLGFKQTNPYTNFNTKPIF